MTRSMQAKVNTLFRLKKPIVLATQNRSIVAREEIHKGDSAFAKDETYIRAPTAAEAFQASSARLLSPASLEIFVHRFSSREIAIGDFESRVM